MGKQTARITLIGGFTQDENASIGLAKLAERLTRFVSPSCNVLLKAWNTDWKSYAGGLERDCTLYALHIVIAYSWGAGHGLKKLAHALDRFDRGVNQAYIIDGVVRYCDYFIVGNVLSLMRVGKLKLADNVREAMSFRQVNDRPPGRVVMCGDVAVHEVVFGTNSNMRKHAGRDWPLHHPVLPIIDRVTDTLISHATIDDEHTIHSAIEQHIEHVLTES